MTLICSTATKETLCWVSFLGTWKGLDRTNRVGPVGWRGSGSDMAVTRLFAGTKMRSHRYHTLLLVFVLLSRCSAPSSTSGSTLQGANTEGSSYPNSYYPITDSIPPLRVHVLTHHPPSCVEERAVFRMNSSLRRSSRLAGSKRLAADSASSMDKRKCYRPKATDPSWQQDCGILPSE